MTEVERHAEILFGEALLKLGRFADAVRAFKAANEGLPPHLLIACGKKALAERWYFTACDAFQAAGYKPGLISCGEKALAAGLYFEAKKAFEAAGAAPSPHLLIACGKKALAADRIDDAQGALVAAGDKLGLIALGEKLLADRRILPARRAFEAAAALP